MHERVERFTTVSNFSGRCSILFVVRTAAPVEDRDLVELSRRGDISALGLLLERHRAALYGSALSIVRDRSAAQDVVQEAFVVALRRLGDLREPVAAGAWLRAVVRNTALMHLRRNREIPEENLPETGSREPGPDAVLDRLAMRDWVLTTLDQLPEDQRVTVLLRYFTTRSSYAQIAAILGIPTGTVRSRLNLAKRRLADALLDTVSTAHADHGALRQQRYQEWTDAIEDMEQSGNAAAYFDACGPDVLVDNPGGRYSTRGITTERHNVESGLALGVNLVPTGIVTGAGITVYEASYENPSEHPTHCPPLHTEVRIHPTGATTRLILHFGL